MTRDGEKVRMEGGWGLEGCGGGEAEHDVLLCFEKGCDDMARLRSIE